MQLTPEQQAIAEQARREGRTGARLELNAEQREEQQRAVAEEEAARDENIAAFRRRRDAEAEPGFAGDLRCAITAARRPTGELAAELGVSAELLEDFREGTAGLPFEAVERLIEALGLRLMQEIRG